jgi:hypothetical protein
VGAVGGDVLVGRAEVAAGSQARRFAAARDQHRQQQQGDDDDHDHGKG